MLACALCFTPPSRCFPPRFRSLCALLSHCDFLTAAATEAATSTGQVPEQCSTPGATRTTHDITDTRRSSRAGAERSTGTASDQRTNGRGGSVTIGERCDRRTTVHRIASTVFPGQLWRVLFLLRCGCCRDRKSLLCGPMASRCSSTRSDHPWPLPFPCHSLAAATVSSTHVSQLIFVSARVAARCTPVARTVRIRSLQRTDERGNSCETSEGAHRRCDVTTPGINTKQRREKQRGPEQPLLHETAAFFLPTTAKQPRHTTADK